MSTTVTSATAPVSSERVTSATVLRVDARREVLHPLVDLVGGVGLLESRADDRAGRTSPRTVSGSCFPNFSAWLTAGGPITSPTSTAKSSTAAADDRDRDRVPAMQALADLDDQGKQRETQQHADGEVGEAGCGRAHEREQEERGDRRRPRRPRSTPVSTVTTKRRGPPTGFAVTPVAGLPLPASVTSLLYGAMHRETRSLATDVEIDVRSIALVFAFVVLVVLGRGVIVAARRPLGWAVASVIAASCPRPAGRTARRTTCAACWHWSSCCCSTAATIGLDHVGRAARSRHASRSTSTRWRRSRPAASSGRRGSGRRRATSSSSSGSPTRSRRCANDRRASRARPRVAPAPTSSARSSRSSCSTGGRAWRGARASSSPTQFAAARIEHVAADAFAPLAALRRQLACAGAGVRSRDVGGLPRASRFLRRRRSRSSSPSSRSFRTWASSPGSVPALLITRRLGVVRSGRGAARDRRRRCNSCTSG